MKSNHWSASLWRDDPSRNLSQAMQKSSNPNKLQMQSQVVTSVWHERGDCTLSKTFLRIAIISAIPITDQLQVHSSEGRNESSTRKAEFFSWPASLWRRFRRERRWTVSGNKYAGHVDQSMFRKWHLLLNQVFSVTPCGNAFPSFRSLFTAPLLCRSLTLYTWYMKHTARASDGVTLTRPPSREIMPHDPAIPSDCHSPSSATLLRRPLDFRSRRVSFAGLARFRCSRYLQPRKSPYFIA